MEAEVGEPSTILTLELDPVSQAYFDDLRRRYYPAELNKISAHMTLFHKLPPVKETLGRVSQAAHIPPFVAKVVGLRSLGRGVAFVIESRELLALHAGLAKAFEQELIPQDRQRFMPHVVVQNKVTPEVARATKAILEADFQEFEITAGGLHLWNYLGGPWGDAGCFDFQ